MSEMVQIDQELHQPLLQHTKGGAMKESLQEKIACRIWSCPLGIPERYKSGITTYFNNFQREINLWSAPEKRDIAIDTYADFLDLVDHLTAHKDKRRDSGEILEFFPTIRDECPTSGKASHVDTKTPLAVRYQFTTQEEVDNSIEITIGLWLMICMGPSNPNLFPGISRWHNTWPQDMTLEQFLATNFPRVSEPTVPKSAQFSKDLTARNLDRIGEFHIKWTSNLKNHLAFDYDTGIIVLYHFASFLSMHESKGQQHSVLPNGLEEETRRTLALLLPQSDTKSARWFQRECKDAGGRLDPSAASQFLGPGSRRIESFKFWQRNLCIIAEAFDNEEPRGIRALWFDRRRGIQRTNFLMAMTVLILTAVFGLISALTGIIQVYYASRAQ